MSRIRAFATRQITTDRQDVLFGQLVCFTLCPLLLWFAILAVERFVERPLDVVLGLLAAVSVSLLAVVIGLLLPLASPKWQSARTRR